MLHLKTTQKEFVQNNNDNKAEIHCDAEQIILFISPKVDNSIQAFFLEQAHQIQIGYSNVHNVILQPFLYITLSEIINSQQIIKSANNILHQVQINLHEVYDDFYKSVYNLCETTILENSAFINIIECSTDNLSQMVELCNNKSLSYQQLIDCNIDKTKDKWSEFLNIFQDNLTGFDLIDTSTYSMFLNKTMEEVKWHGDDYSCTF